MLGNKLFLILCFSSILAVCSGCSMGSKSANKELEWSSPQIATAHVIGREGRQPEGVVRYCWEEPIVDVQKVGPGVNSDGHWYYPAHLQVREARMGRWRPCVAQKTKARKVK